MKKAYLHIFVDITSSVVQTRWNSQTEEMKLVLPDVQPTMNKAYYGEALFSSLISQQLYDKALHYLQTHDVHLTILIYQDSPEPFIRWELLHDGNHYLTDNSISVMRAAKSRLNDRSIDIAPPFRVLFIDMNDNTDDLKMLQQQAHQSSGLMQVDTLYQPSRVTLLQHTQDAYHAENPYHAWHYSGSLNAAGHLALKGKALTSDQWWKIQQKYPSLKIATLNLDNPAAGTHKHAAVPAPVACKLPFLISPTASISADIRHSFFKTFYRHCLEDGLHQAFRLAQVHVRQLVFESSEWAQIAAFITTADDTLIQPASGTEPPVSPVMRDQVFISYSHRDKDWLDKLMEYLSPLRRHHVIEAWVDKDIPPGSDWFNEIYNALHRMKVAVILASPSFFDSSFITNHELPYILECRQRGECTVLWVAVSMYPYELTDLNTIQAVATPDKPLDELDDTESRRILVSIARRIASILSES